MIEEIKISDTVSIYKTKVGYNKERLLKELYYNVDVNALALDRPSKDSPGVQAPIVATTLEVENLFKFTLDLFKEKFNITQDYYHRPWVYISSSKNPYSNYHKHDTFADIHLKDIEWTYTFYVQMPDNISGEEGYLFFKTEDEIEYKILPEEGNLIIFPANLAHRPEVNRKSTKDRVVLAGMITPIDINETFKKKERTLL